MSTPERSLQVIHGGSTLSNFSPEKIAVIKNTVAKGATNDELEMFLYLASRYNLDPFMKEIWCIKRQKKDSNGRYIDDPNTPATIMTSRDGYLKVAQADSNFDGIKSFVVKEGDTFEIDAEADKVIHKFGNKRGKILGAWAVCFHKQRRPAIAFVDFEEYKSNSPIWSNYPSAMIQKVAEVFVLKRQFSISGLVTQEEMDSQLEPAATTERPHAHSLPANEDAKAQWLQAANELHTFAESNSITKEELRNMGNRLLGKSDPRQWSVSEMATVRSYIESMAARASESEQKQEQLNLGDGVSLPNDEDLPF